MAALKAQRLRVPAFDPEAVARAEAALEQLSGQFPDWLGEETARLEAALADAQARDYPAEALFQVYVRAHDVKGLGATCKYPLITQLAASLCRLIQTEERRARAARHAALMQAAVAAIRVALRDGVRDAETAVAQELAAQLQARVAAAVEGTADG